MASNDARTEAAPPKVLVVEDEPGLRFLLVDTLEHDHGFAVIEAASGDQALKCLERDGDIKCVFTDVRMPGKLDGVALSKMVLRDYPLVKVMITSGHMFKSEGLGGVPFVAKPYNLNEVAGKIDQLIHSPSPEPGHRI